MFDVNPLGPLTHLKELERQAISRAHRRPGEGWALRSILRWLPIRGRQQSHEEDQVPVASLRLEMDTRTQ
jgi:hypothetical protein